MQCDFFEQPGRWRLAVLAAVFCLAFAPALPLLKAAFSESAPTVGLFGNGFGTATLHSFEVGVAVAILAIFLGVPAGLLAGLYEFPARRLFLALIALPLLVPSFLWAIGFSQARIQLGLPPDSSLSGLSGTVLAFTSPAFSLVFYMTLLSSRRLTKSQVESAKLAGGEWVLLHYALRAVLPSALLTGALASIFTLSDPGPGQILGHYGVSYEILLSFSALYDFALAARQCAALAGAVFVVSLPVAIYIAPHVATALLGRDVATAPLSKNKMARWLGPIVFTSILLATTIGPLLAIVTPLFTHFPMERALQEVKRTLGNTVLYATSAGMIATALGFLFAIAVGRAPRLRQYALVVIFLLVSLPPSISALGVVKVAALGPAMFDPVLRGRFAVGMVLALRYFPVAAILAMRSFGSLSPSQAFVAAIHGVPLPLYIWRVFGPMLAPSATLCFGIISLLATSEVGTVLLLRPPGADSLPVQIFTVMANAPETLVSALCFIYLAGTAALLLAGWFLTGRERAP